MFHFSQKKAIKDAVFHELFDRIILCKNYSHHQSEIPAVRGLRETRDQCQLALEPVSGTTGLTESKQFFTLFLPFSIQCLFPVKIHPASALKK